MHDDVGADTGRIAAQTCIERDKTLEHLIRGRRGSSRGDRYKQKRRSCGEGGG